MESCVNKYLHKKFKKQITSVVQSLENAVPDPRFPSRIGEVAAEKCGAPPDRKDNNNASVPKQSTNNINSPLLCNVAHSEKSSISNVIKINVITRNDESQQSCMVSNHDGDETDLQSNSCISYIVSSRVDSRVPVESSGRGANFDTHFNVTEPKQLKKSSNSFKTLDSVPLSSNLVSLEKNEDLFLNPTTAKEVSVYDNRVSSKGGERPELSVAVSEKSSGGKYVCTYCNLACSKPSVLQKHIRAHTNERPYPCLSCGSRFKTRSNLYKHCRSRTHANRVMGNKNLENNNEGDGEPQGKYEFSESKSSENVDNPEENPEWVSLKTRPYKPRFHTMVPFLDGLTKENINEEAKLRKSPTSHKDVNLSSHINDIINKNYFIVNSGETPTTKKHPADINNENIKVYVDSCAGNPPTEARNSEEPLNLSNKNRKRCLSEVAEPSAQKSLIKELLLKNLYAGTDMQCPHCKMLFQTVTELELHKLRSCKGFTKSGVRYSRSSSVNVASILTQNKNAFDDIPQLQDAFFPLKSPGPFLGKTRLVESDKNKSFSFDDGIQSNPVNDFLKNPYTMPLVLPLAGDPAKKPCVKLFGGEVKITHTSGETKSFKVDSKEQESFLCNSVDYCAKLSENRVVKSILQSGGTVLQNKPNYNKRDSASPVDVMKVYNSSSISPKIDRINLEKAPYNSETKQTACTENVAKMNDNKFSNAASNVSKEYANMTDFSQKAAKLFAPNLKQLNLTIPGLPMPNNLLKTPSTPGDSVLEADKYPIRTQPEKNRDIHLHNPMTLLVNGKVVRYVPGMPGPVTAEVNLETPYSNNPAIISTQFPKPPTFKTTTAETNFQKTGEQSKIKLETIPENREARSPKRIGSKSPVVNKSTTTTTATVTETPKKFARPNSLPLKPPVASMKQHHGLTPTVFNQILISPDTPRVAKKYNQHFLHGNYFSYLGLKSSTKSVYCTINKTQPFYVPYFKKLSMYSEWRQQDTKTDKLYVSAYDSRQKQQKYTTARQVCHYTAVHSNYKFSASSNDLCAREDDSKTSQLTGGYESNNDYTYVRGRGRGRYVCDQCGIRCKKPSMLKKHIRTHTNDRPYTCNHSNFSFKTKGNLTKHMKCKSHTKNCYASSTSNQLNSMPSSESDTDDSGMDSSDESTRQHEAAYGLLSLSQKTAASTEQHNSFLVNCSNSSNANREESAFNFMDNEEIVLVTKTNFAKNKILDQQEGLCFSKHLNRIVPDEECVSERIKNVSLCLGKFISNRPLTYPYTSPLNAKHLEIETDMDDDEMDLNSKQLPDRVDRVDREYSLVENKKDEAINFKVKYADVDAKLVEDVVPDSNRLRHETRESKKRKLSSDPVYDLKILKEDSVMDLSLSKRDNPGEDTFNSTSKNDDAPSFLSFSLGRNATSKTLIVENLSNQSDSYASSNERASENGDASFDDNVDVSPRPFKSTNEYDNSAMETLADIATKQIKLEKNSVAKNVATEFLKLATKIELKNLDRLTESNNFIANNKDVNDIILKREENKSCTICSKNFSKPSQLRLHMNVHYIERPFRCESCSVSFRTKGHLQKHERSVGHHNKLSSSPTLSSSEPRPFKCTDCNIAFRIHGHLAKHLRSKMHIMKLECLAKIPFGLYAELERSNSLLTEINTSDGDQCLESLKTLAKKVFVNDPNKLNQLEGSSSSNNSN